LSEQSRLFVYCDGPKSEFQNDNVKQVREIVKSTKWCGEVNVIEREHNFGLARSVISGVSALCEQFGNVIVLEDDLLVAPAFLSYMNAALDRYDDEPKVMQVSGYSFTSTLPVEDDAIFLPFTTTWGWATWARAWQYFDDSGSGYQQLRRDSGEKNRFDLYGAYPYFDLLERQLNGRIDSWGIYWYLTVFQRSGLTLFPVRSVVHNAGFDGSGTHESNSLDAPKRESTIPTATVDMQAFRFPSEVCVSAATPHAIRALERLTHETGARRTMRALRRLWS
jgi:hypothetical protein